MSISLNLPQFLCAFALFFSTSCGLFIQDSVTFHGTQCSDSRVWIGGDIATTAAFLYLASSNEVPAESYLPAAALLTSAVAGYYKRQNCVNYQRGASPQEWARDRERERQADATRLNAIGQIGGQILSESVSSGQSSTSSRRHTVKYNKKIYYECDDSVLVDQTFTSYESCARFRDKHSYTCHGTSLPIRC